MYNYQYELREEEKDKDDEKSVIINLQAYKLVSGLSHTDINESYYMLLEVKILLQDYKYIRKFTRTTSKKT